MCQDMLYAPYGKHGTTGCANYQTERLTVTANKEPESNPSVHTANMDQLLLGLLHPPTLL